MKEGSGQAMSEKFGVPFWISPLRMLDELGVAPDAVTDIVLSHAHFDHMGSIHQFPHARIHIQKRELLSWIEALAMPRQFATSPRSSIRTICEMPSMPRSSIG